LYNQQYDLPFLKQKFLRHLKRNNYSEETIDGYMKDLKLFGEYIYTAYEGVILVQELQREDLLDYLTYLKEMKKYKVNSVSRHLSTLKSFYRYLFDERIINDNVAARIKHFKAYVPLPAILDIGEIELLLQTAKEYKQFFFVMFSLIYYTGSRITPVITLEKKNIDLKTRKIYFPKVKGGKDLYLPIHDKLIPVLTEFLERHPADMSPYVFPSPRNIYAPVDAVTARLHLNRVVKKAGITKRVTPHILRHCMATHLTTAQVPQKFVAEMLGHSDLRSTIRYQHLHVEDLRDHINVLGK
jgi:site-specific recombinase XerD